MADKQLKLQVLLGAVEKVTAPLKNITRAGENMAKTMKASRDELKRLEKAQGAISTFRDLKKQAHATQETLGQNTRRIAELSREIKSGSGDIKQLTAEKNRLIKASKTLAQRHDTELQKLNRLRNEIRTTDGTSGSLANRNQQLASRIRDVNRNLEQQQSALRRTAEQQRKLTAAKAAYDKRMATAGKLAGTGAATTATGAAMLYGGARFMGEGLSFDATMSNVQSLTRLDKNSEQLKALRAQARQLGAETSFTAGDAASGQAFLAMAGFTPNAIRAAMPGLLDVARAGGTDLAITADISSNILSGMGLDPAKMGNVADVLVGTFTRSNTSLEMLGETMKYVAPVANSYHQSIETVLAATGKLGDAGVQGSQAGTSLKAILSRLAAPPAAAAAAIEELGIQTADASGNMRALPDILLDIHKATQGLGDTQVGGLLKAIAGEEATSALTVLVGQAGTGALQEMIGTLKQAQGEAAKTASIMGDNLKGDIDQLSSSWADLRIELFDGQNSGLRQLAASLKELIGDVSGWVKANPELAATIVKVTAAGAALLVVIGSILTLVAGVLIPMAALKFAMVTLGIKSFGLIAVLGKLKFGVLALGKALLMNPIGIAIAAIVALGAAIWWAWNNIEPFRNFMLTLWDGVTERWQEFVSGLRTAWSGGFVSMLEWTANLLLEFNPLALIYKGFAAVVNWLGGDLPTSFKDAGAALMAGLVNGITSKLSAVKDGVIGAATSVKDWFKGVLGINSPSRVFTEYGVNTLQGFSHGIESESGAALRRVREFAGAATGAGSGIMVGVDLNNAPAINAATTLTDRIENLLLEFNPLALIYKRFAAVVNWLGGDLPISFKGAGAALMSGLLNGITSQMAAVREGVIGATTSAGAGSGIMVGVDLNNTPAINSATTLTDRIENLLLEFNPLALIYKGFSDVVNWLGGDLPTSFKDAGAALMNGLLNGITSQMAALREGVIGAATSVKDWFKGVLGINSPSRVFAEYGVNTLQGFSNGIDTEKGTALRRVREFAGAATAAGAGILMSGSALAIDNRPPLSPANYAHAITGSGGDIYNFYITPPAGTDPHAIAQEIERILQRRDAEQQRQQRGILGDRFTM